jgi:hypothetical protein
LAGRAGPGQGAELRLLRVLVPLLTLLPLPLLFGSLLYRYFFRFSV